MSAKLKNGTIKNRVSKAVAILGGGVHGQRRLAKRMGIVPSAVRNWLQERNGMTRANAAALQGILREHELFDKDEPKQAPSRDSFAPVSKPKPDPVDEVLSLVFRHPTAFSIIREGRHIVGVRFK